MSTNIWQTCPLCSGSGYYLNITCHVCSGSGIISLLTGLPPEWAGRTIASINTNQTKIISNRTSSTDDENNS